MTKPKVIAILIAYNAEDSLKEFYASLPKNIFSEILLFDDASGDNTYNLAKKLKIESFRNSKNLGYGGNLKKAIKEALRRNADIIVDIHPDGEYSPTPIPSAISQIKNGSLLVLGNRFYNFDYLFKKSGIYKWKIPPITLLNLISKAIFQTKISDLHQGFRVYSNELFKKINIDSYSNNYLFSFELIAQAFYKKAKISEIPVKTSYSGQKRGSNLKNSILYTSGAINVLIAYLFAKIGFKTRLFK